MVEEKSGADPVSFIVSGYIGAGPDGYQPCRQIHTCALFWAAGLSQGTSPDRHIFSLWEVVLAGCSCPHRWPHWFGLDSVVAWCFPRCTGDRRDLVESQWVMVLEQEQAADPWVWKVDNFADGINTSCKRGRIVPRPSVWILYIGER